MSHAEMRAAKLILPDPFFAPNIKTDWTRAKLLRISPHSFRVYTSQKNSNQRGHAQGRSCLSPVHSGSGGPRLLPLALCAECEPQFHRVTGRNAEFLTHSVASCQANGVLT